MLNRSVISCSVIILVIITSSFELSVLATPVPSFFDRLIRANPLRAFTNYLGQKLTMEFYYPPVPRVPTHYVKMPVWKPIYYTPSVAMVVPAPMHTQYRPHFVHGVSYPMPQPVFIQPAMSSYNPVKTEPLLQQNQGYHLPKSQVSHSYTSANVQQQSQAGSFLPTAVMSPPEVETVASNYGKDNNYADNMVKIVVIQPKEMEALKNLQEISPNLNNRYTMKYIDVDETPNDYDEPLSEQSEHIHNEKRKANASCVNPLCDPFLRKLIPELFSSSNEQHIENVTVDIDTNANIANLSPNSQHRQQPITIIQAVENEDNSFDLPTHMQLPPLLRHGPSNLISARINSSTFQKLEAQSHPQKMNDEEITHMSSLQDDNQHVFTKDKRFNLRNLQRQKNPVFNPPPKSLSRPSLPQRAQKYPFRHSQLVRQKQQSEKSSSKISATHYKAGIVFNEPNENN